eukprot:CAMPEP_0172534062 /NCGR_PEP_ID=MMETSP1067-20121228/6565_1 /TAXON_ID=265564 ORGANISM="Thalassiosira punctigera, Strain Tpunct2005C2" /NCGR_SAMPLE_ID=MMETSP1067 /ASSEMBLY_ACC=CAM_ASM_000444 /LENGTH=305 /DNA_ID=CAMNT_0013318801 /DNA_START=183 /DNA_END=1097 /DNA_ORIENTATION=-
MNIARLPSIDKGLTVSSSSDVAPYSSVQPSKDGPVPQAIFSSVSRVVTKESLQEDPREANTVVSSSPPIQDFDDRSLPSSLFDFSILEPDQKERELLSLPLTNIELPLTPPPLESNAVSGSFDSCAAALLTPAASVSTAHSSSSLLSTAAAIAATQHQQQLAAAVQPIRAPPIVSVAGPAQQHPPRQVQSFSRQNPSAPPVPPVPRPPLPSVVSPKPKRRKAPAKKKAAGAKKKAPPAPRATQQPFPQGGAKATSPPIPVVVGPAPQILAQRLMTIQQQQQARQQAAGQAPPAAAAPMTAPSLAP